MRAFLCAAAIVASSLSAHAQSTAQSNVLKHLADMAAFDTRCSGMSPNTMAMGAMMEGHGISAADVSPGGRFSGIMLTSITENLDALERLDESSVCTMAYMFFGPEGGNVPGLMVVD